MIEWFIVILPFTFLGMMQFIVWLKEKMLVRKGFYKVIFRMPNHRIIKAFLKPAGKTITHKSNTYGFSDLPEYIYYNGNTPQIEFNQEGSQINFGEITKSPEIDPQVIDAIGKRSYNLGKKESKREEKITLILLLVAAGCSSLSALMLWQLLA